MNDTIKIAAVQMDVKIMDKRANLDRVLLGMKEAASQGAKLIVFPECALTGYVFASREEALPYMETVPGPSTGDLACCCRELGVHAVVGLLEADGHNCFNIAVMIGPKGVIGKYRKIHLPFLGIDRFLDHGDQPFGLYRTPVGNIGPHICYDCNFPESARIMTLMGADILVLITNWPKGREKVPQHIVVTRAYENKAYIVAVDRVGTERGITFIGHSKIVDTLGNTVVEASGNREEVIYAELDLAQARQKRRVFKAGEFEMDFIADRRPEFYGEIARLKK